MCLICKQLGLAWITLSMNSNHLEERLLDQAQVCVSYTPPFWGVRVAYPKARY